MRRVLLLLLMLLLPWQGAWASELKPCAVSSPCGGAHTAAVAAHTAGIAATDIAHAAVDEPASTASVADDTAAAERCNGDCQACQGHSWQALLGHIGVALVPADRAGYSAYRMWRHQHQRAPLLRPPWLQRVG